METIVKSVKVNIFWRFLFKMAWNKKTAILLSLSDFALEDTISKTQENQVELKFNGTYQLLVHVDDKNLLGDIRLSYIVAARTTQHRKQALYCCTDMLQRNCPANSLRADNTENNFRACRVML
jgi:hypothetical protein